MSLLECRYKFNFNSGSRTPNKLELYEVSVDYINIKSIEERNYVGKCFVYTNPHYFMFINIVIEADLRALEPFFYEDLLQELLRQAKEKFGDIFGKREYKIFIEYKYLDSHNY